MEISFDDGMNFLKSNISFLLLFNFKESLL
jgi:hypothetical protein